MPANDAHVESSLTTKEKTCVNDVTKEHPDKTPIVMDNLTARNKKKINGLEGCIWYHRRNRPTPVDEVAIQTWDH